MASTQAVRFDDSALLGFLDAFDPLAEKYRYARLGSGKTLDKTVRKAIYAYEALRQPLPQQNQFGALYQNLRLIYGDSEPILDYLEIYNMVHVKLLAQYLRIPGLGKLFTSQYFRYEWDMHLGIDYDGHNLTKYRDHFIHQVKNVHAMFVLLEEFGFLDDIVRIVKRGGNVMATYILKAAGLYAQFADSCAGKAAGMSLTDIFKEVGKEAGKEPQDLYIERIVLGSAVMAGLFHDIGYPISHSRKRQKQMEEYLPTIAYFLHGSSDYARIASLLGNTLLYTIVSKDEIYRRYERGDHGTLSALALLLYFYESGAIDGLDPIQRASIDLAALTIYNHTLDYECIDKKAKDYYRPVYYRNPVSFLFRVCDDLQEWQRLYFHLVDNRNWRICHKCLTPVVHRAVWDADKRNKTDVRICGCCSGSTRKEFIAHVRGQVAAVGQGATRIAAIASAPGREGRGNDVTISNIRYRRLNHVKLCDWGEFRPFREFDSLPAPDGLVYEVHYDCYKLLQMAAIDPSFAPHRAGDFRKLRRLLKDQDMPEQLVISFVSTNPITLKVKILDDFLRACAGRDGGAGAPPSGTCEQDVLLLSDADLEAARSFYKDYSAGSMGMPPRKAGGDAARLAEKIAASFPSVTREMIKRHLEVYLGLLQTAWDIQSCVVAGKPQTRLGANRKCFKNELVDRYRKLNSSSALDVLLEDFRRHAADGADFERCRAQGQPLPECYETQYAYDEDEDTGKDKDRDKDQNKRSRFCTAVRSYTARDTYHPFKEEDSLDFYGDLYMFYVLSRTAAAAEKNSGAPGAPGTQV